MKIKIAFVTLFFCFIKVSRADISECTKSTRLQIADTMIENSRKKINFEEFKNMLDQETDLNSFQKKMVAAIWKREAQELGGEAYYRTDLTGLYLSKPERQIFSLTELAFPIQSMFALWGSKSLKQFATKALIEHPVGTILMGASLLSLGQLPKTVAQKVGVFEPDILSQHFWDTSTLKNDEAFLILQFSSALDKSWASKLNSYNFEYLKNNLDPQKVFLASPNQDNTEANNTILANIGQQISSGKKKIVKLGIVAHGSPGKISVGPNHTSIDLGVLGENLGKILPMAPKAEVFFDSCLLAANDSGIGLVQNFGNQLLPRGGKVTVNRFVGLSGGQMDPFSTNPAIKFYAFSPIIAAGTIVTSTRQRSVSYLKKNGHDIPPNYLILPQQYTYVVP